MRQCDSPVDQDIQNQERQGSEQHLPHGLDDGDHPTDGLLHLYPGPGVHLRQHAVHAVRGDSDAVAEALLRVEVNGSGQSSGKEK